MAYNPLNPNGQATMANSQPVVLASDQSTVSVTGIVAVTGIQGASVSGTVGASILGTVPVTQVTNPWVITGSVQGTFSGVANQSVSGTVGASVIGIIPIQTSNTSVISYIQNSVATVIIGGSIAASFTPPANQSVSGTVNVGNFPTNQSVSGTISVTTTDISPATQNITVIDSSSSTATGANGQSIIIGTPTAGSAASFAISGIATVRVEVTGIWTGTLTSEQSIDGGTTWTAQGLHQGAYTTSAFTAGFIGGGNVAGATNYRIRATAAITGTAVVKVVQSVNEQSMYIANAAPAGTVISLLNSTTATLGIGATFTGTGEDVSNFSEMRISVFSDQASGTDGLSIQQSTNNTNWDIIDTYTIAASTGKTFVVPRQARYYRIVYTNGGTGQGSFRLQSILNRTATAPSSNRASDGYTNETDLVQNQTFNMIFNGSTWDRARGNATQGTQIYGSVIAIPTGNQSVSGTVGASVIGLTPVSVSNFPTTQNVSGSVVATQGTSPWIVAPNNSSIFALQVAGSILAVSGSFTPAANQSVSGTVGASIIGQLPGGTAVLGSVAALQGTNPWIVTSSVAGGLFPISGSVAAVIIGTPNVNVSGSVVAFQGGAWAHTNIGSVITVGQGSVAVVIIGGSIAASFTPPANQSVSGTVNIGTGGPVSVTGTMSVLGTVPVTQVTTPWVVNTQNSSILAVPVGSTIAIWQSPSIVGTYAEDAASGPGDKGIFILGVRNDTLASVTSADSDYSTFTVGPTGEQVTTIAPYTKWIQGQTSVMYGASVAVIAAQGASIFTYMTAIQVTNMSANAALVTFSAGSNSTLGFTIAPANGGSNIVFGHNALKTPTFNKEITASISGVSSVYLSAQGFIARI